MNPNPSRFAGGVLYTTHTMSEREQTSQLQVKDVYERLDQVIDPELGISIVKLGLIYEVHVEPKAEPNETGSKWVVKVRMTLTTPGCPLAGVFDHMVKDSMYGLPGLESDQDIHLTLTFDPPWTPDMMDEEARAELGF